MSQNGAQSWRTQKLRCQHRPGGGSGARRVPLYQREVLEKAVVDAHRRLRTAGMVNECPGRVAISGGVGPDSVGEGGQSCLRIADTHLPGEESKRLSKGAS